MVVTLSALARELGLPHTGEANLTGVGSLEQAGPNELSFLADKRLEPLLESTRAGAVIVPPEHEKSVANALISENPLLDFARAANRFMSPQGAHSGISPLAYVAEDAQVAEGCDIFPHAYVGARSVIGKGSRIFPGCYVGEDCVLGEGCLLYPGTVLMAGTVLGKGVTLQPGCVLGADGFGYTPSPQGLVKVPQLGHVTLGDNVEIGANATVDRATLEVTEIGQGVKIDNLVQVGHNCSIGAHSVLAGLTGISGSVKVGKGVTMGGQVGVRDHVNIGDGATLAAMTGVPSSIKANAVVGGAPAMNYSDFVRNAVTMKKLHTLPARLRKLEKELEELKKQLSQDQDND